MKKQQSRPRRKVSELHHGTLTGSWSLISYDNKSFFPPHKILPFDHTGNMPYWIYILTNVHHTTLYIGMTSNIYERVEQHRIGAVPGFTARYRCEKLVYLEEYETAMDAITREKQLKRWGRRKKVALIEMNNPHWEEIEP